MSSGIGSASLMPMVTTDAPSAGAASSAPATAGAAGSAIGAPLAGASPPTADAQGTSPPTGGAPPTDAFASVLSTQVARTALAEGQSKQTSTKGGKQNATDADTSGLASGADDSDSGTSRRRRAGGDGFLVL